MRCISAAILLILGLAPASAETSTRQYEADFGDAVRAYLLDNPEVILEVFTILERQEAARQAQAFDDKIGGLAAALHEAGDPSLGTPGAPIKVVEFFDYQCGYCRSMQSELHAALDGRTDVEVILKEFPILGAASESAARMAMAIRAEHGDAAYVSFHTSLLSSSGQLGDAVLGRLAAEAGYDPTALTERGQQDDITATLARNRALARQLDINGTPAFVFEDEVVGGMMRAERLIAKLNTLASATSHTATASDQGTKDGL